MREKYILDLIGASKTSDFVILSMMNYLNAVALRALIGLYWKE